MAFARLLFLVLAAAMLTAAVSYAPPVWEGHFYRDMGMGGGGCVTISGASWVKDQGACLAASGDAPVTLESTAVSEIVGQAEVGYRATCERTARFGAVDSRTCGQGQPTEIAFSVTADGDGWSRENTPAVVKGTARTTHGMPYTTDVEIRGRWRVGKGAPSVCAGGRGYDIVCREGSCISRLAGTTRVAYPATSVCME